MQILFDNWTGRYDDECLMPGDIVEAAMVYNFRENAGNQTDTMIQMGEVADIVGNLPIYDTIYKENRYSPWKYAGQCCTHADVLYLQQIQGRYQRGAGRKHQSGEVGSK